MAWPTTNNPRTEFVTLRLTVDEASDLDVYAATRTMSRSEAVRDAVSRVIAAEKKRTKRARRSKGAGPKVRGEVGDD